MGGRIVLTESNPDHPHERRSRSPPPVINHQPRIDHPTANTRARRIDFKRPLRIKLIFEEEEPSRPPYILTSDYP